MAYVADHVRPNLLDRLDAAGLVGTWVHDTTDDRVIADPGVARLFGVAQSDPSVGTPFAHYLDGIHPADRASLTAEVQAASRVGGAFSCQYRIRTSSGVRWIHDYGSFTLDTAGNPVRGQGIVLDVTAGRREVEAVDEIARRLPPDERVRANVESLARHVIEASEIARMLSSRRLQRLTDPLLWEVGRLLAWVTTAQRRL